MPDCKPCLEDRLEAISAVRVVNGVPLCGPCFEKQGGSVVLKREEEKQKEEAVTVAAKKNINWEIIQKRRDAGENAFVLMKELGVSSGTFYTRTHGSGVKNVGHKTASSGMKLHKRPRKKADLKRAVNGKESVLNECLKQLKREREELDVVIQSLEYVIRRG